MTRLVVHGADLTSSQVKGIMANSQMYWNGSAWVNGLIPNTVHVSLPDFAGAIPEGSFSGALESFTAPRAIEVGSSAFFNMSNLTTVDLSSARIIRQSAFQSCGLIAINLPAAYSFGADVFGGIAGSNLTLKINSPVQAVAFDNTFSNSQESSMTLHLGAGVSPARPASLPVSSYTWNGVTFGTIKAYEELP